MAKYYDYNGNEYDSVVVEGYEIITAIRATNYADGTAIPHLDDAQAKAYAWPNDTTDEAERSKLGALYNWNVVDPSDPDAIFITGFRVPTQTDWEDLRDSMIAGGYNWDGTTTGNKIGKSIASIRDWSANNIEGNIGDDKYSNNGSGLNIPGAGLMFSNGNMFGFGTTSYIQSQTAGPYQGYMTNAAPSLTVNSEGSSWLKSVIVLREVPAGRIINVSTTDNRRGQALASQDQFVLENGTLNIDAVADIDQDFYEFDHWEVSGTLAITDANSASTTITNVTENGSAIAYFKFKDNVYPVTKEGQSNAQGRDNSSGYTAISTPNIAYRYDADERIFVDYVDPDPRGGATFVPSFINDMITDGFTGKVLVIENAEGGIGMARPSDNMWSDSTDTVYTNANTKIDASGDGVSNDEIKAVFYYGSETDTEGITQSAYETAFQTYAANRRSDYGNIPIFIVKIDWPSNPTTAQIRTATDNLPGLITDTYVVADTLGSTLIDEVHLSKASQDSVGTEVADNNDVKKFFDLRFVLQYTAGGGGTLTGDTSQEVNLNGSGTIVTAVPDSGYEFVQWSDGVLTAARTDNPITEDINVTAEFASIGGGPSYALNGRFFNRLSIGF